MIRAVWTARSKGAAWRERSIERRPARMTWRYSRLSSPRICIRAHPHWMRSCPSQRSGFLRMAVSCVFFEMGDGLINAHDLQLRAPLRAELLKQSVAVGGRVAPPGDGENAFGIVAKV